MVFFLKYLSYLQAIQRIWSLVTPTPFNHPWGKEIQVCSNKVPRVMYGPTPGA